MVEVLMANGPANGPPRYAEQADGRTNDGRNNRNPADETADSQDGGGARVDGGAVPPTREQIDELNRMAEQTLHTSITATTPEGIALEAARLATLAERAWLEQREKALEERARNIPTSSRNRRQLFPNNNNQNFHVLRTPVQNLVAATQLADTLQPSGSATEGLRHIQVLLKVAMAQNSAITQSHDRIHSRSVRADTTQSAHSPHVQRRPRASPPPDGMAPPR